MLQNFILSIGDPLVIISPLVILALVGLIIMLQPLSASGAKPGLNAGNAALISLILALVFFAVVRGNYSSNLLGFLAFLKVDHQAGLITLLLLVAAAFSVVIVKATPLSHAIRSKNDFYALLLFSVCGAWVMLVANELVTLFVGLELTSLALYALCASASTRPASVESGFKYLLTGSFSSAFFLLGMAFYFGATGKLVLGVSNIPQLFASGSGYSSYLFVAGLVLMVLAIAFKIALAPFHSWATDVYEGAPTGITLYMSTAVKAVSLAVFFRLLEPVIDLALPRPGAWLGLVWLLACLTMLVGNLLALRQVTLKRLLACSSIAHAGYVLLALPAAGMVGGVSVFVYYLFIYMFLATAAFGILALIEEQQLGGKEGSIKITDLAGLYTKSPALALGLSISLLGLAGLPPVFGGLLSKALVFAAALSQGMVGAVVIAAISAAIGAAYYLKVLVTIYFSPAAEVALTANNASSAETKTWLYAVIIVCCLAAVLLGVFPGLILVPNL
jgi:NADH-quinone oxidoreductase subunit N